MISGVVYLLRIFKMFHGLMNKPVFMRVGHKISLRCTYFAFCTLKSNKKGSKLTLFSCPTIFSHILHQNSGTYPTIWWPFLYPLFVVVVVDWHLTINCNENSPAWEANSFPAIQRLAILSPHMFITAFTTVTHTFFNRGYPVVFYF